MKTTSNLTSTKKQSKSNTKIPVNKYILIFNNIPKYAHPQMHQANSAIPVLPAL